MALTKLRGRGIATTDTLTVNDISVSNSVVVTSQISAGSANVTNVTVGNDLNRGAYKSGEIIERITTLCDGSTFETMSGSTLTTQNVTGYQRPGTSYVTLTGSLVDGYIPPASATKVEYQFETHVSAQDGADVIQHMRFYLGGTEVTQARHGGGAYRSHEYVFKWIVEIGDGDDTALGKVNTWTTSKNMYLQSRCYSTSYDADFHETYYFDGGASTQFSKPRITITAIA